MAKKGTKKVKIAKALWGKFSLPYKVGQEVDLEEKLADELLGEGYAELAVAAKAQPAKPASDPKVQEAPEGSEK